VTRLSGELGRNRLAGAETEKRFRLVGEELVDGLKGQGCSVLDTLRVRPRFPWA
jgi:hypothetical protein